MYACLCFFFRTVKLGLYVPGLVRTFGYYVLSVDHGHRQSAFFALSLFWIKRTLFRTYLFSFPLRVRNNRVSLYLFILFQCNGSVKNLVLVLISAIWSKSLSGFMCATAKF